MSDAGNSVVRNDDERRGAIYGLYRARVIDNDDPMSRGRVNISLPQIYDEGQAFWAEACLPAQAFDEQLSEFLPPVGAVVWIAFEEGDPGRPIWIGAAFPI
jgi:hypothetical protein